MVDREEQKKMLQEIKRIAEKGSPVESIPVPVQEAPVISPAPKPKKGDQFIEVSKEDFDALIAVAKQKDMAETLGQQIEAEKTVQTQTMQPQEITHVEPQPNLGIASMDYGGLINRPTVLYFDTDRTCQLIQPKVNENGSVIIGDRTFDFSKGQPSILNMGKWGRKQSHPFYIIKYSSMNPIDIAEEYPESNPTPEQASRLIELGTLETLSKIPGGKMRKGILILLMVVSMIMGAVMVYMLSMFGVI